MIEKGEEHGSSAVKMKIRAKKQTAKEKNGGISRKIKDLRRGVEALLKQKFVKNVVQDLTSGGHEWKRAKWSAPVRKYWKYSEKLMVCGSDLVVCDSKNIEKYIQQEYGVKNTAFIAQNDACDCRRKRCKQNS